MFCFFSLLLFSFLCVVVQGWNPQAIRKRKKKTQIMFKTFNESGFYVVTQTVLSFSASGRTTGIVLEADDGVAHTVPIYEGYCLPHAVLRLIKFGKTRFNGIFTKILSECGDSFASTEDKQIAPDIKENLSYVLLV